MNTLTRRTWTAREICYDPALLTTACTVNVQEVDVGDVDVRRVCCARRLVDVEVALIEDNGIIRVLDVDVFVCDVADVTVADIWSGPVKFWSVTANVMRREQTKTYQALRRAPFCPLSRVTFSIHAFEM